MVNASPVKDYFQIVPPNPTTEVGGMRRGGFRSFLLFLRKRCPYLATMNDIESSVRLRLKVVLQPNEDRTVVGIENEMGFRESVVIVVEHRID